MNVTIHHLPERRLAAVRHTGPYEGCGAAWEKLCAWAGPRGLLHGRPVLLGLCWDDPETTPPEKVRYDACLVLAGETPAGEGVESRTIPDGDYACVVHEGPFGGLKGVYEELLGTWAPSSGRTPAEGPSLEIYHNDPQRVPPEKILVEIQVRLES